MQRHPGFNGPRWTRLTRLGVLVIAAGTVTGCASSRTAAGEIDATSRRCLEGVSDDVSRRGIGTYQDPDVINFVLVLERTISGRLQQQRVAVEASRSAAWWQAREGPLAERKPIECQVREAVPVRVCGGYSTRRTNLFIAERIIDRETGVDCQIR